MNSRSQTPANAGGRATDAPAVALSPAQTMVLELVKGLRRVMNLHGDAVNNAEQAVRSNERARRDRTRVADEVRAINAAYPADAAALEIEQATR